MKLMSWLRGLRQPERPPVVVSRNTPRRERGGRPQAGKVDWDALDNPSATDDPFATDSWESLEQADPRQLEVLEELDREPGAAQKKVAYNPYDTSAFKVHYSNQPERETEDDASPRSKKKKDYNPYDSGSFHGRWNKIPR